MEKSLIVLEPRIELSVGIVSNIINRLRNFMEGNLWASPLIKRIANKTHQVSIVSPEAPIEKKLVEKWKIRTIERAVSQESLDCALEATSKLAKEWYLYGKLPELLQIGQVNIGDALQNTIWYRFSPLFRQVELADSLLEEERPDTVYIESNLFPSGRAFDTAAAAKGIKRNFLQPIFYRKLKNQIRSYLNHRNYKANLESTLYSIPQKQGDVPKYKILVYAPYINFFNAVFPAVEYVLNQQACKCYVIGEKSYIAKKFKEAKEVDTGYDNIAEYMEQGKRIRAYYHSELEKDVKFQDLFTYKGINLWSISRDDISHLFDRQLFEVMASIAYFHKVINLTKPDILVVGYDRNTFIAGHVLLARKMGIPTLEIQHGLHAFEYPVTKPLSDKIAAGGDYSRRSYINFGASYDQVVITGWPKYDVYTRLREEDIKKKTTDILFATYSEGATVKLNFSIIETIGLWLKDVKDIRLIVKPHPQENEEVYHRITRKYEQVILHRSQEDIAPLIASSDILIAEVSTVGIEAALLDVPVISITIRTGEQDRLYVASQIAIEVSNLNELVPTIEDVLYNEETRSRLAEARREFVHDHAYIQDGQASRRVADLIIQMIEESRRKKEGRKSP